MIDSLCIRHFGIMRWQIDYPVSLPQLLIPSDPLLLSSFNAPLAIRPDVCVFSTFARLFVCS